LQDTAKTKKQLIGELDALRRERIVEQALERVRAEALSMQATDDLVNVVAVLYQEMAQLDIEAPWCAIFFIDEEADSVMMFNAITSSWVYIATDYVPPEGVFYNQNMFAFKYSEIPFSEWHGVAHEDLRERWHKGERWTQPHRGQVDHLKNIWTRVGIAVHEPPAESLFESFSEKLVKDYTIINVPFEHGIVSLAQEQHRPEDEPVVQALTEALSLGFVRFLDFQKLEEQVRQAQIEAALERVRTEVAAMQQSDDLFNVVDIVRETLIGLDVPCEDIAVNTIDEEAGTKQTHNNRFSAAMSVPLDEEFYEPWKKGEPFSRFVTMDSQRARIQKALDEGLLEDTEENRELIDAVIQDLAEHGGKAWIVDVPFAHGTLSMNRYDSAPFTAQHIHLLL